MSSLRTVAPRTKINGGQFEVPEALGNKLIHPYSDFLLHDVGTGDGIVQNGDQSTANNRLTSAQFGVTAPSVYESQIARSYDSGSRPMH